METQFYKCTGLSLSIGSFLAIITMTLHPAGGSMEHLIQLATPLKFTHTLAIFCLPFILFGFYGLTHRLSDKWRLSTLALIIVAFGLFAAMLAALLNGLVLPYFLSQYSSAIDDDISIIKAIMNYGFAINKALDYVFIISLIGAISQYSLMTIRTKKIPRWLGYYGISLFIFTIAGAVTNFVFTDLMGFRIFVFSITVWMLYAGIVLITSHKPQQ